MLVRVEAVQQGPSESATVRAHSPVGTAVVFWQGSIEAAGHEYPVEWSVDEDMVWEGNARPTSSATPELREEDDRIVFRGRLSLTEDGGALLDVGGTLIPFDLAGPPPPDDSDGAWIEVYVGRNSVSLWPYQL